MQFAPVYPLLYKILQPAFPSCLWSGKGRGRSIALTFDDGPHPDHTPRLLDVLEKYKITASFFWLGACVEKYGAIAQAVAQRGHWIGLHGYHHHNFPTLTPNNSGRASRKPKKLLPKPVASPLIAPEMCVLPMASSLPKPWNYCTNGSTAPSCGVSFPKTGLVRELPKLPKECCNKLPLVP